MWALERPSSQEQGQDRLSVQANGTGGCKEFWGSFSGCLGCHSNLVISMASTSTTDDAKQCPWCGTYWLKDEACNFVTCGNSTCFPHPPQGVPASVYLNGCGKNWCFQCGKKLCSYSVHTETCCKDDPHFQVDTFCPGGHHSHCPPRTF